MTRQLVEDEVMDLNADLEEVAQEKVGFTPPPMYKFKPLRDCLLVEKLKDDETTEGGIIIPGTVLERPSRGRVLAAGPGKVDDNGHLLPMTVKEGDLVTFGKYSGQEIQLGGVTSTKLTILKETEVFGTLELE